MWVSACSCACYLLRNEIFYQQSEDTQEVRPFGWSEQLQMLRVHMHRDLCLCVCECACVCVCVLTCYLICIRIQQTIRATVQSAMSSTLDRGLGSMFAQCCRIMLCTCGQHGFV